MAKPAKAHAETLESVKVERDALKAERDLAREELRTVKDEAKALRATLKRKDDEHMTYRLKHRETKPQRINRTGVKVGK